MDFANLVKTEQLFKLDIEHPVTGKPTGIIVQVRSAGSDEAKKVVREQTDDILERQQRRKLVDAELVESNELDQAVSYVASWDWGGHTYDGKVPDNDPKTIRAILVKEQTWLYAPIVGAARNIANFTTS